MHEGRNAYFVALQNLVKAGGAELELRFDVGQRGLVDVV